MSEKALELVRQLKHLPGKHPQKSHGGGRGSGSSGGSGGGGYGATQYQKLEDSTLEGIKRAIDDGDAQDATHVYESSDSMIGYDAFNKIDAKKLTPEDTNKLNELYDRKASGWEKAFQNKYGASSSEYAKTARKKAMSSYTPTQRKVADVVGSSTSSNAPTPKEIKSENMRYAVRGGEKNPHIVVATDYTIGAPISPQRAGMDLGKFASELEAMGIPKAKKGKL